MLSISTKPSSPPQLTVLKIQTPLPHHHISLYHPPSLASLSSSLFKPVNIASDILSTSPSMDVFADVFRCDFEENSRHRRMAKCRDFCGGIAQWQSNRLQSDRSAVQPRLPPFGSRFRSSFVEILWFGTVIDKTSAEFDELDVNKLDFEQKGRVF
ncbi:hypothetical protein M758_7G043900 [Ceratodon purpureus]|nr:hypothetical protein M758_7G043900 [Ceratodon purpureus]